MERPNYDKLKFWTWLIAIVFLAGVNVQMALGHIIDDAKHLDQREANVIDNIIEEGFTFSQDEKQDLYKRIVTLEVEFEILKERLSEFLKSKGY